MTDQLSDHHAGASISRPGTGSAGRAIQGERRFVTILFCDVKGSTAMAEQLDPEEWAEIMNEAFAHMLAPIYRYEGTVARLMGDGFLAFFGAPFAHEDDPLRAVLAGLDILAAIKPLHAELAEEIGMDFGVRVGINTGTAVVGEIGSGAAGEYTAMGDAVNLAARMEQTAAPGSVQIAEATYRLVASWIECESLGALEISGKSEPVGVYRALARKAEPDRLRGLAGRQAPLIGREVEVARLRQSMEDAQRGRGGIICLIGEAGIGKSRLVEEMKAEWLAQMDSDAQDAGSWLESRGISYDSNSPYGLFRRFLRGFYQIREDDPAHVVMEKVESNPLHLPADAQTVVTRTIRLLLEPEGRATSGDGESASVKEELTGGIIQLFQVLFAHKPTVVALDDLHWADHASAELLQQLFPLCELYPVLFLCIFRPDRTSPAWEIKQYVERDYPHRYREISLSPLSRHESETLIEALLDRAASHTPLEQAILRKTEGNPLFIEEMARGLLDSVITEPGPATVAPGRVEVEPVMPDTLQALLMARIDRLEGAVRGTLQVASVIGRNFSHRLLEALSEDPQQTKLHINGLERSELISVAVRWPEPQYLFRHELIRDVAYQSILHRMRRRYHRQVASALESLYPEQIEQDAHRLAYHFFEGHAYERAVDYYTKAGDLAVRLYAGTEAVTHYSCALEAERLLNREPSFSLLRARGRAYELLGAFDAAQADLETALTAAEAAQDRHAQWQSLIDLGFLWASRDYEQTGAYFRQALTLARSLDEPVALAHTLNRVGNWYANVLDLATAQRYHPEALTIFEQLDDLRGQAETLDLLGMTHMMMGQLPKAADYYTRAVDLFRTLDDRRGLVGSLTELATMGGTYNFLEASMPASLSLSERWAAGHEALELAKQIHWRAGEAYVLGTMAWLAQSIGDFAKSLQYASLSLEIAQSIEHRQWMCAAHLTLGILYYSLFALPQAQEQIDQSITIAREIGSKVWEFNAIPALALCHLGGGDAKTALALVQPWIKDVSVQYFAQPMCYLVRAQVALVENEPQVALEIADELLAATHGADEAQLPRVGSVRSVALTQLGRMDEAEAALQRAEQGARAQGIKPLLWQIQAAMGDLYHAHARQAEAEQAYAQASMGVVELAANIPDPELRNTYLRAAAVRFPDSWAARMAPPGSAFRDAPQL